MSTSWASRLASIFGGAPPPPTTDIRLTYQPALLEVEDHKRDFRRSVDLMARTHGGTTDRALTRLGHTDTSAIIIRVPSHKLGALYANVERHNQSHDYRILAKEQAPSPIQAGPSYEDWDYD